MAEGKQGSTVVTITYDNGSGVAKSMGNHILEAGPLKETIMTEPSHAFGDAAPEHTPTGFVTTDDIVFSGFFATGTDGPHDVFKPNANDKSPQGTTRTLVLGYGDSVTYTIETRLISYELAPENEKLTKYTVTVKPHGAGTWAP